MVTACSTPVEVGTPTSTPSLTPQPSQTASLTASVTATASTTPIPPTPTPQLQLCQPLENVSFIEMTEILSQPLITPYPGRDDGHHGVDFSFYRWKERIGMEGLAVYSILSGKVAAISQNRPPYGNMVIIETPLESLPADWLATLPLPTLAPTLLPNIALTCPTVVPPLVKDTPNRSLYLLYAHMKDAPLLKIGDRVTCGQKIGEVGNTGMSSNPHLHLESRIGPGSARLGTLAHYDYAASPSEQNAYCTWRIMDIFQLFDPLTIIASGATKITGTARP